MQNKHFIERSQCKATQ